MFENLLAELRVLLDAPPWWLIAVLLLLGWIAFQHGRGGADSEADVVARFGTLDDSRWMDPTANERSWRFDIESWPWRAGNFIRKASSRNRASSC